MRRTSTLLVGALGAAALATGAIVTTGGDDGYSVKAYLDDAGGLRDGSVVTIGGVNVGEVDVELADRDRVEVRLKLKDGKGPVGRDASFAISSVNLLGQKRVDLDPGAPSQPATDGAVIPSSRVTKATDLDQVLNVLDAPTRDALRVLLNEAGTAFFGRKEDVLHTVGLIPDDLRNINRLFDRIKADNGTIEALVDRSDGFIGELAAQRERLGSLVDTVGRTSETVAQRRVQLEQTLQQAPGTLRSAQRFLRELESTARPLGPAARDLSRTAPALNRTLAALDPFTTAAEPALAKATDVAPTLTRLGKEATPVLRQARPTAAQLRVTSKDLEPIAGILRYSAQNIIATMDNWSGAVQGRDGLSHVFRAEASVSPQILDVILKRYAGINLAKKPQKRKAAPLREKLDELLRPGGRQRERPGSPVEKAVRDLPKRVTDITKTIVEKLVPPSRPDGGKQDPAGGLQPLLDYLIKP